MTDKIREQIATIRRFPRHLPSGLTTDEIADTMEAMRKVIELAKDPYLFAGGGAQVRLQFQKALVKLEEL